jgi:hypothetical protein
MDGQYSQLVFLACILQVQSALRARHAAHASLHMLTSSCFVPSSSAAKPPNASSSGSIADI